MAGTSRNGTVRAVGYLRRSTDKQEASIPEQRRAVEQYAAENGYSIVRWYTDDAISGDDTEKRHAFKQVSLEEFVGEVRFGKSSESVIERGFVSFLGTEAVGFPGDQF